MTPPIAPAVSPPRRPHVKIRQARQARQHQQQSLTGQIMATGQAAASAATVTKGGLAPAELAAWTADYEARLQAIQQHPEQNLGHLEEAIAAAAKGRPSQSQCHALPVSGMPPGTDRPKVSFPGHRLALRTPAPLARLRLVSPM
jgi:hypothetical protein